MGTYEKLIAAFVAMGVFVSVMLGGEASHAAEGQVCGPDPVPIVVIAELDDDGYIRPSCSKCAKLAVERQTAASGEVRGVLELVYFDHRGTFGGAIEVTAVLGDGSERVVVLDDVWLEPGDEAGWELAAATGWHWGEVVLVRLRFVEG